MIGQRQSRLPRGGKRVQPRRPPPRPDGFDGLAAPSDVCWRVNAEIITLLGWGRAVLLQFAHPKIAAGVAEHSHFRATPTARLRRFQQTIATMLDLTFGTTEAAVAAAARIDAIHGRVRGTLAEDAGRHRAGDPYFACDPDLLRWVHATLIDSFILIHQLFLGPLTPTEQDSLCAESTGLSHLLGIPEGYLPANRAELRDYLADTLASGEIAVGDTARQLARHLFAPPFPVVGRPIAELVYLPSVGLLPEPIRADYGLPWDERHERLLLLAASFARLTLPRLPASLRWWPVARRAYRRFRLNG